MDAGSPIAPAPHSQLIATAALAMKPPVNHVERGGTPGGMVLTPPAIVTSKEWIIPPRPKPGRKPATDTPPTKRKAQNRAAQRAFRERRAAKVGELEEHIKKIEEEDEREQLELRETIARLENDVTRFKQEMLSWKARADALAKEVETEKALRQRAEKEIEALRKGMSATSGTVPLLPRKTVRSAPMKRSPDASHSEHSPLQHDLGCGNCTHDGPCKCIDEAFNMSSIAEEPSSIHKRPHSPALNSNNKRLRDQIPKAEPAELEIDFTAAYSSTKLIPAPQPIEPVASSAPKDPCGFCQEGTLCICAELEKQEAEQASNRLAPLLSQFTPPPMDGDVDLSARPKLEPLHPDPRRAVAASANSCANGPGTCAQCQADPQSTLFCKSLAAMRGINSTAAQGGCCGKAGGCCRSGGSEQSRAASISQPSLSCADTYKTLSRHPHYSEASDELGSWLGRLNPSPHMSGKGEDYHPMEVEAASVMGVLKLFDRRFGRGDEA